MSMTRSKIANAIPQSADVTGNASRVFGRASVDVRFCIGTPNGGEPLANACAGFDY